MPGSPLENMSDAYEVTKKIIEEIGENKPLRAKTLMKLTVEILLGEIVYKPCLIGGLRPRKLYVIVASLQE